MNQNSDIQIPSPQATDQSQPAPQSAPEAASTGHPSDSTLPAQTQQTSPFEISIPGPSLTGNEIIIGAGISLVLAALFWFVGRIVTDTLVKQFAEVGAAKRAGTSLFIFLALLGLFATFGFLGNFWTALFFVIPGGFLTLLMFFVFIFSFVGANRSKRK